ncbi:hypothetical protein [Delftia sp. RIT313]|uniref:hypothetical protein n=1 Tax=Delftia sp. RIT313 TaxID=1468410 RepID=UPI000448AAAC|nr:hypothetical protein [Delftia sp. RIT313]EZP50323.1 hypothetical protein BW39_04424 [Delftia sp. RIT313]
MSFTKPICIKLWRYSGFKCAAPACGQLLEMPGNGTIGEAAHIIGEKKGAARYDAFYINRNSFENGIYLCTSCHRMIDRDPEGYPTELLKEWKEQSNKQALDDLMPGRKLPVHGAVDIIAERDRAKNYLDRHAPLFNIIEQLFFFHSRKPNNKVSNITILNDLKSAIARAESLMNPFGVNRKEEYCYSEPLKRRQAELQRHLKLVRAAVPILKDLELDFERSTSIDKVTFFDIPELEDPISTEGKILHRYRIHYREFVDFLNNADNWKVNAVVD